MSGAIANLYEESTLTVEGIIHKCTRIIERNETVAGAGRRMRNPMLSIFMGKDAVNHIREIQEAYYSCWSDHARNLKILKGAYTVEDIEDAIVQSTQTEDRSIDTTIVHTAWFWDIMDDDFDRLFECVKQKFSMPIATRNQRVFFIFCSQKDSKSQERTRLRLKEQLIPWAQETGNALVVLSDSTRMGTLNATGLSENYRLAASLMLIINSIYPIDKTDLGIEMAFELGRKSVWSASYHGCSKNFYDIVGVSLLTIIKKYRELGKLEKDDFGNGNSVQSRLCGDDKNYYHLLDEIFNEIIQKKCNTDTALWVDTPYTEQVAALEENMLQGGEAKGGFFGKLFGGKKRSASPEEAIASMGDFWKCCVEKYYAAPVLNWLDSPAGMREVQSHMYSRMTTVLNYDEMNALLLQESQYVASLNDNLEMKIPRPNMQSCKNPQQIFHGYALREVKLRIFKKLLKWLSEAMETLCSNAAGFDDLLEKVQNSLREEHMEHSVVRAYGSHMEQLIEQNSALLVKYIRPSKDEGELLQQLEQTFAELVALDTKHVYHKSLQGDLQFRIENGGAAAAVNVIANCFKYKMADAGRLPTLNTPSGTMYCIMNDAMDGMGGNIAADAIGKRFIVSRSDRIERLFLFSVDPDYIMFSNNLE
jgi:hypothetical protein